MEYMQGVTGIYVREETAVTLGKFDGIHKGHRKLIRRILQAEKKWPVQCGICAGQWKRRNPGTAGAQADAGKHGSVVSD